MGATHEPTTVIVNVFLASLPPPRQVFGVPLLIVTATGNGLGGATVATYNSPTAVAAALTATEITAQTADFVNTAFAQQPRVPSVKVTAAAASGYELAYAAARAADDTFYGVAIDTQLTADILEVSAAVETDAEKLFIASSADADWLTSGVPAAFSAAAGRERTAIVYHDIATEPVSLAWLAARLGIANPDNRSAPWTGRVREILAYTTDLTGAQRDFALANQANLVLPFGTAPQYIKDGENISGRPLYEILSGDWYKARVREDLIQAKLAADDRGEKILVGSVGQTNSLGQTLVRGILESRAAQGEAAGHFVIGGTRVTMPQITQDDIDNRRIRADVELQIGVDTIRFEVNAYEQTTPLAEV